MSNELREAIKEYLENNIGVAIDLVQDLNSWNGCLDYLEIFENDEDNWRMIVGEDLDKFARMIYYGDFNYNDEYFRLNGYGNIETFEYWQYEDEIKDNIDEIIDNLENEASNINIEEYKDLAQIYKDYGEAIF